MRGTFVRGLTALAENDERVILLTGDLGFAAIEPFSDRFPERFFNVGVAEQNMVGIATGLAEAGYLPFVYSIATFAALRPYEFIRNGPILQHLPVRIIGVGGGFEYGAAGPTHHALEDVGVMRVQPGLTIVVPADHQQALAALAATWSLETPIYYRLGKDDSSTVPGLNGRFELGRTQRLREGEDVLLLGMGPICAAIQTAAEQLAGLGVSAATTVVASISPAPVEDLIDQLAQFRLVMAIEAHYAAGGLGSLVSEIVTDNGLGCVVKRCGIVTGHSARIGGEGYLLKQHHLDVSGLVTHALQFIRSD
jgi:transketolase